MTNETRITCRRLQPLRSFLLLLGIGVLASCTVPDYPVKEVEEEKATVPGQPIIEKEEKATVQGPAIIEFEPWTLDETLVKHTLRVGPDEWAYDFTSIQTALETAMRTGGPGEGVRVLIAPGIYRETLDVVAWKRNAPLVIEGEAPGTVVVSGADIFSDWVPHATRPGIYSHAWTHKMGPEPNPWPNLMPMKPGESFRREMLFVEKKPYRQRFNMDTLDEGSYWVDDEAGLIHLHPLPEHQSARPHVEVSVRPLARMGAHSKLLRVIDSRQVVLRNMVFEYAAIPPFSAGAVQFLGGERVLIEDCIVQWNNGVGLLFGNFQNSRTRDVIIRRVQANHNGTLGLSGGFQNALVEDTEVNYNNWRGAERGATGWAPCGFKFSGLHQVLLRRMTAAHNHASGGWLDDHITHVVIEDFHGINNFRSGLSLEAVDGPVRVTGAILMGNSTGLNAFDSEHIYVTDSLIVNNETRGIRIAGSSPLSPEKLLTYPEGWRRERLSKRRTPQHYHIINTLIAHLDSGDAQLIGFGMREDAYQLPDGNPALQATIDSLVLQGNHYYLPESATDRAFSDLQGRPAPFDAWRTLTGQEHDAVWGRALAEQRLREAVAQTGFRPVGFGVKDDVTGTEQVDELEL